MQSLLSYETLLVQTYMGVLITCIYGHHNYKRDPLCSNLFRSNNALPDNCFDYCIWCRLPPSLFIGIIVILIYYAAT